MNNNPATAQEDGKSNLFQWFASSLRIQFSATTIALAVVPLVIGTLLLAVFVTNQVRTSLTDAATKHLTSIREARTSEIADYFEERKGNMAVLVETAGLLRQQAFDQLRAVQEIKSNAVEAWFNERIGDALFIRNLVVIKGTAEGDDGLAVLVRYKNTPANPAYVEAFKRAKTVLSTFIGTNTDYVDVMLVDITGEVVFALDETFIGTDEADRVEFQQGLEALYVGDVVQVPNRDERLIRITVPVNDYAGRLVGVLLLELRLEHLNAIVQARTGLGATAESYLVGKVGDQNQLRSNRVIKAGQIGDPKPGLDADEALSGLAGQVFKLGSAGVYEASIYEPLDIPGLNWAIITTGSVAEIMSPQVTGSKDDFFTNYKEAYGYDDLLLILPDGYIFYTVEHKADYQSNILTGPDKDSHLADLVREVLTDKSKAEIADFARYAPSNNAPTAFVAAPLLQDGEVVLVVAAQISLDQINAIMQTTAGLGETGETYLVGADKLWRSDSRFLDELGVASTVLNEDTRVETEAVLSALAGESGTQSITDYRGQPVLSSWSAFSLEEPDPRHPERIVWAVIAEISEAEALADVTRVTTFITVLSMILLMVTVAIAVGVGFWTANRLVQPIIGLTDTAVTIASGNIDVDIAPATSVNEVGVLTNAFPASGLRWPLASVWTLIRSWG